MGFYGIKGLKGILYILPSYAGIHKQTHNIKDPL